MLTLHFGSAVNPNVRLRSLALEVVYRRGPDGEPIFVGAPAPSDEALQAACTRSSPER